MLSGRISRKKFAALAERSGVGTNVHFLGRNDIAELMAAADLYCIQLSGKLLVLFLLGSRPCWFAGADNRGVRLCTLYCGCKLWRSDD